MILFYEGTPGSGKTYDIVVKIVANLAKGRKVYTNIDGLDDVACLEMIKFKAKMDDFDIKEKLVHFTTEQAKNFWDYLEPGCMVVIDEAHKIFNARDWQSKENRKCADWCSTARHEGIEAVFVTQKIEKVDSQIRSLTEWTYRYKKINFMGSLINKSYLCFAYAGDDTTTPISKKAGRYNKEYFRCYKSYAGKDIKELDIQTHANILKHPIFFMIPIALLATAYFLSQSSLASGDILGVSKIKKAQTEAAKLKIPEMPKDIMANLTTKDISPKQPRAAEQGAALVNVTHENNDKKHDAILPIKEIKKATESIKVYAQVNGKKIYYCDNGEICEK